MCKDFKEYHIFIENLVYWRRTEMLLFDGGNAMQNAALALLSAIKSFFIIKASFQCCIQTERVFTFVLSKVELVVYTSINFIVPFLESRNSKSRPLFFDWQAILSPFGQPLKTSTLYMYAR